MADPWSSGPWEWRTLGVVDPGNGGPKSNVPLTGLTGNSEQEIQFELFP